jgi:hypothetical protein
LVLFAFIYITLSPCPTDAILHDTYSAKLLHLRKKTQPSAEWLRQLPHKARKLEERLYWYAPSLADYLEMSTLKNRLRRVADSILKTHTEAKRSFNFPMSRSSVSSPQSSRASFSSAAMNDSSHGSVDSLRSLSNAFLQKSNLLPNMQQMQNEQRQKQQVQQLRQQPQADRQTSSSNGASTQLRNSFSGSTMNALNSIPETRFLELGGDSGNASSSSSASGTNTFQRGTASTTTNTANTSASHAAAGNTGSNSKEILDLERQKAINANLQQQVLQNIRRQEMLVRQLQERRQAPAPAPSASAPSIPTPSNVSSAPGSEELVRLLQERRQVPAPAPSAPTPSTVSSAPGSGIMSAVSAMQVADMRTSNMYMQGNEMNLTAGAPFGTNFNATQNALNAIQSGGGLYNPVHPFLGQGRMSMESDSLGQSGEVMSNPQLSRLLAANPSFFAPTQQQQQLFGASSTPVGGGFNPSMPPPNSNSLPGNSAPASPSNTGNRDRNGEELLLPDSPLSPGSFNW